MNRCGCGSFGARLQHVAHATHGVQQGALERRIEFVAQAANGNVDQVFSPETYLDIGFSYAAPASWRLDVLVQNVLNDYPDKYVLGNRASGINPYSFIAPNGASGRFIQGSVTYSF